MRIFAVSGFSKTGKTTTIAKIVEELVRRGFRVGTIKDSRCNSLSLEQPGTDTFIHRQAGDEQLTLRTLAETNIMLPRRAPLTEILSHYQQDIIILEGFSQYDLPKIVTGIIPFDVKARQTSQTFAVSGIISGQYQTLQGLPVINGLTGAGRLCDLILAKVKDTGPEQLKNVMLQVI